MCDMKKLFKIIKEGLHYAHTGKQKNKSQGFQPAPTETKRTRQEFEM